MRLPDLASRLKAAATVEILEPDDLLLAGVITKLFADRQVEVEPHVVQFLVRRIERSLSTAIGVVDRLDRAALEQKTRITRALAAETVNALDRGPGGTRPLATTRFETTSRAPRSFPVAFAARKL